MAIMKSSVDKKETGIGNQADISTSGFNLSDCPWIPVIFTDGSESEVSLSELFRSAPKIQAIAGELPQMSFTIVRLALAILYRAYIDSVDSDPTQKKLRDLWRDLWQQGNFDDETVEDYLAHFHDRFDLFDEAYPFFQVSGLKYTNKNADPIGSFMVDVPKLDKYLFSMRSPQYTNELSYAEAARYLLLAQAFDPAGIKSAVEGNTSIKGGKVYAPKEAVGTGWCGAIGGTMLEGETLFETLLYNFVLYLPGLECEGIESSALIGREDDLPPWELPSPGADSSRREPRGPVDVLTWQSRRIRLVRDTERKLVTGVVLCYGTTLTAAEKQACEQMTAWRESAQQQKRLKTAYKPLMPLTHDPSRTIWRSLPTIISFDGTTRSGRPGVIRWLSELEGNGILTKQQRFGVHTFGMNYGTQSSVFEDAFDDTLSLHLLLVLDKAEARQRTIEMVNDADKAVSKLVYFVRQVESAKGDKRRYESFSDNQANAVKNSIREQAYEALDLLFRDRIAELTPDEELLPYFNDWGSKTRKILLDLAYDYISTAPVSMFVERTENTPGRALMWLEINLKQIFPASAGNQDAVPVSESE